MSITREAVPHDGSLGTGPGRGADYAGNPGTSAIQVRQNRIFAAPSAPLGFKDPAEFLDFARPVTSDAIRFDMRTDAELRAAAFDEETPLERERALWEYADRHGAEAQDVVISFLRAETHRAARAQGLWLLQRTAGPAAADLLSNFYNDHDPEVADWSRVLAGEVSGQTVPSIYNRLVVHENRTFDQTLPLLISGYALVNVPGAGRMQVTLSPLWFDSILGRVMACTNQSTFMTDLVIEKALEELHADGSTHYEIFKFKGFSFRLTDRVQEHHYESLTMRRFYPSGIVEDGDSVLISVPLARIAGTETDGTPTGTTASYTVDGDGPRAERIRDGGFVRTVRGRYFGWAAINLDAVFSTGRVAPGFVQLANPTDPIAGPMTNTRLYGTFRGKIGDVTGDGILDVNTIPCHGTVDGEHDLHCDGSKVDDPFAR